MELKIQLSAFAALLLLLVSCSMDMSPEMPPLLQSGGFSVPLSVCGYEGEELSGRSSGFDRVEFIVTDAGGQRVRNLKGRYDAASSSIHIERLQEGDYMIHVLGITGDSSRDGAEFHDAGDASDVWLTLDAGRNRPLSAEYFHASMPFRVSSVAGPDGETVIADIRGPLKMRRAVARLDFNVRFSSIYIEHSVISMKAWLDSPSFYTGIRADGSMTLDGASSGVSAGERLEITLDKTATGHFLMPSSGGELLDGMVEILSRDYRGNTVRRLYSFVLQPAEPNRIISVDVTALHPEDGSGMMFVTESLYEAGDHGLILQDDEPHGVYTDKTLRNFNTSRPLQISVTDDGQLAARFYSPRNLTDVLVRAMIPGHGEEAVDLAYFDRIPAFADFSADLPLCSRDGWYRTAGGALKEIPRMSPEELSSASFEIVSSDPYWDRLKKIRHGWNIRFDLFGGDPTLPDGGPQGNWMGIRPVHCREAVAFFLNFTYMIDMPEHEAILKENEDRLYGNGGVDDKVSVATVLSQMRQTRTVNVGLVYPGNGVVGLGGGSTFGAYQGGWVSHYTSLYACEIMFHELGHVMGYNHSSSFTYGPWAQELMNTFYVSHISGMPVDSPEYLASASNPNLYP